ncbi:hypothetical protein PVAG01_10161 [Phlyctema vagabunda]|uniref:L-tryptophan decarboxylase PsiD-like domain-containing protein n=1 Tax=Phlyctema vagabunda TaxID=108571 RepID=A0ABR4P552_9HELO
MVAGPFKNLQPPSHSLGHWLPKNRSQIKEWLSVQLDQLDSKKDNELRLDPTVVALETLVAGNQTLTKLSQEMFTQIPPAYINDPFGKPQVRDFNTMLRLVNQVLRKCPEWFDLPVPLTAIGLIGFPIDAILDWPIAYPEDQSAAPGLGPTGTTQVIVAAHESTALQLVEDAELRDVFWLKGQPYSLVNMLDNDPLASEFVGGSVYQAFLSALSYHRWRAPVSGTVVRMRIVAGTYYSENLFQGFIDGHPDPAAANNTHPHSADDATRGVIFFQADNPEIGLMAIVFIGMAEVSSREFTVGKRITRGQEIGIFHFGGSSQCILRAKTS